MTGQTFVTHRVNQCVLLSFHHARRGTSDESRTIFSILDATQGATQSEVGEDYRLRPVGNCGESGHLLGRLVEAIWRN
jgi:hypothetical protein